MVGATASGTDQAHLVFVSNEFEVGVVVASRRALLRPRSPPRTIDSRNRSTNAQ